MNYALFGPVVFNCAAPDDGNMTVLNKIGTERQKTRWLQPIVDGKVRSSIVMTEPAPGAGSDPTMMKTTATKKGDKWVVQDRKSVGVGKECRSRGAPHQGKTTET